MFLSWNTFALLALLLVVKCTTNSLGKVLFSKDGNVVSTVREYWCFFVLFSFLHTAIKNWSSCLNSSSKIPGKQEKT